MPKTAQLPRSTMMFLAAALTLLASLIEFAVGFLGRHMFFSLGAMFLSISGMWLAIGAKYRKDEQKAAAEQA